MKKISAVCDRCKTEYDDPKKIKTLYVQDGINGEGGATAIDLCMDCYKEFLDWLYQNDKKKANKRKSHSQHYIDKFNSLHKKEQ